MKNENRSIEDIYKYTNDIIFEEEGEQTDHQDSDNEDQRSQILSVEKRVSHLDKSPSFYKNSAALMTETFLNANSRSKTQSQNTSPIRNSLPHANEDDPYSRLPASVTSGTASEKSKRKKMNETIDSLQAAYRHGQDRFTD